MAVVFSNNATTVLSSNITNSATSIAVQDGSVFPTLSGTDYFYATLQDPGNTKREIVKVTARSGNTLTVTRAVDGSSASAFSANDAFELRLNAAALNDAVNSGTADLELNSFTGDGSEVDFTLSMEALEANTLVYIDGVYQNKTAYSISGYVLTFSAAPDNGAAIEVTTATVAPIQESTDFLLNQFTGDGSDTTFTLSSSPEENQTTVFISGVYQSKSNYSISGTTLTFSTAPPASSSIEVMVARTVVYGIGTPSNDTVSTAKIVDGAVTPAKLSLTYATETYVGTAVSNLVDSSPAALDTLNELAAALGDDPNFATTVTNSIALKAPLASPSFTGDVDTSGLLKVGTNDTEYANNYIRFKPTGAAYIDHNTVGQAINFRLSNASSLDKTVMTLSSAGNVGINETVPFGKLHISDTQTGRTTAGSVGNLLVLEDDENGMSILSADAGAGYILFGDTASASSGGIVYDHSANKFNFRTNDAWNRMILDASGNLLLGVTTAYSGGKLSVNGGIVQPSGVQNVMGVFGTSGLQMIGVTGGDNVIGTMGANEPLVLRTESAERMRIDPDGATIYNGKELRVKRPNGSGDIRLFNTASYATLESTVDPIYIKSAHAIRFDTGGNNQRMLLDNSGNLLVGRSSDSGLGKLQVYGGADIAGGDVYLARDTGNVLVGTTDTTPGIGDTGSGVSMSAANGLIVSRSGEAPLNLNRNTNDGEFILLRRDGAGTVSGTIGVQGSRPYFGNNINFSIKCDDFGGGGLVPANQSGTPTNNVSDIGGPSAVWNDLYLGGGVYLGGTGAANKLDDYEEGIWTPVIKAVGNGGNNATYTLHGGSYTKVGRLVNVQVYISGININAITAGSYITLQGFPFACTNYADFTIAYKSGSWSTAGNIIGGYLQSGQSYAYFMRADGLEAQQTSTDVTMTKAMINITYQAS